MPNRVIPHSRFTNFDIDLFAAGKHYRLYEKFGSHIMQVDGQWGVYFAVYAPAARKVEVIGNFNHWNGYEHDLNVRWDGSGIWEGFISGVEKGELYKYRIWSNHDGQIREKADPYARQYEMPPKTASIVWADEYAWSDKNWRTNRHINNHLDAPMSVYELHLGSWKKRDHRSLHYTERLLWNILIIPLGVICVQDFSHQLRVMVRRMSLSFWWINCIKRGLLCC